MSSSSPDDRHQPTAHAVAAAISAAWRVSEGLRAALVPQIAHMSPWLCTLALLPAIAALGQVGIPGFRRRALD